MELLLWLRHPAGLTPCFSSTPKPLDSDGDGGFDTADSDIFNDDCVGDHNNICNVLSGHPLLDFGPSGHLLDLRASLNSSFMPSVHYHSFMSIKMSCCQFSGSYFT